MEISKEILTALISAFGRAHHSVNDEPKIFDDFLAKCMMTEELYNFFGHSLASSIGFFDPEFAASKPDEKSALSNVMKVQSTPITLSRARYTEDCLDVLISKGYSQYVILGAGMDTFVFRKPELAAKLHVYEIDQTVTQEYKRSRLNELGWEIPEHTYLIPVDFSKDSLAEALVNAGFDTNKPAVISWLGVTYYLNPDDALSVLTGMSGIAASGSVMIFDYLDLDAFDEEKAAMRVRKMREVLNRAGEPMKTGFEPSGIKALLQSAGLHLEEDLSPDDIQALYFKDRIDGYSAFEHIHFVKAIVI